jgi:UDP-N-acetylenolpyruvoylglucosamine reductase
MSTSPNRELAGGADAVACERLRTAVSEHTAVRQNELLARRTTLRVGGKADFFAEPASENDLAQLLRVCSELKLPFTIIGRGSNLLIRDGGVRGVVICLGHDAFSHVQIIGEHFHCGAGAKLKTVSVEARRAGLAGLEFLEGIPGSVGGALRMNAGAMGSWMFEVVEQIRFMDFAGNVQERKASEVNVEYRGCPLFKTHIALGAILRGTPAAREVIQERAKQFNAKRWESQPAQPSAGCIFKNPKTVPAGKLIEELGLKGTKRGGAMISTVHGNFIVNEGDATAKDVLELIEFVKQTAKTRRGIELETEVEIIGD